MKYLLNLLLKNEEAKMIDEKDKEFYDIILSGLGFEVEFIENE